MALGITWGGLASFAINGKTVDNDLLPAILRDVTDALTAITDALKILDARVSELEHE